MSPEEFRKAHPELDTDSARTASDLHSRLLRGDTELTIPSTSTTGRGRDVSIGNIDVGGITVTSPSADPAAVAREAGKVFDEKLGNVLRRTRDAQ